MMKNAFYFTLKVLSILKISKFLSWHFGQVEKLLDYKDNVNFKIDDVWNKQLKYSYCTISQDVKAVREWNLVS